MGIISETALKSDHLEKDCFYLWRLNEHLNTPRHDMHADLWKYTINRLGVWITRIRKFNVISVFLIFLNLIWLLDFLLPSPFKKNFTPSMNYHGEHNQLELSGQKSSREAHNLSVYVHSHDDMSACARSYRCGSAGEPPGILLSGTGRHTGHKLWPSRQLDKRQKVDAYYTQWKNMYMNWWGENRVKAQMRQIKEIHFTQNSDLFIYSYIFLLLYT